MMPRVLLFVLAGCLHGPLRSTGPNFSATFRSDFGLYLEKLQLKESGHYVRAMQYHPRLRDAIDTSVTGTYSMLEPGVLALSSGKKTEVWILARAGGGTLIIPLAQIASICEYVGETQVSDTLFATTSTSIPTLLDLNVACGSGFAFNRSE